MDEAKKVREPVIQHRKKLMSKIQPLDIVQLDSGAVGIVTEGCENHCSVQWFGGGQFETKSAWWRAGEKGLRVIDTLPAILASMVRHSMSVDSSNSFEADLKRRLKAAKGKLSS